MPGSTWRSWGRRTASRPRSSSSTCWRPTSWCSTPACRASTASRRRRCCSRAARACRSCSAAQLGGRRRPPPRCRGRDPRGALQGPVRRPPAAGARARRERLGGNLRTVRTSWASARTCSRAGTGSTCSATRAGPTRLASRDQMRDGASRVRSARVTCSNVTTPRRRPSSSTAISAPSRRSGSDHEQRLQRRVGRDLRLGGARRRDVAHRARRRPPRAPRARPRAGAPGRCSAVVVDHANHSQPW